jgi:hypothetical protein
MMSHYVLGLLARLAVHIMQAPDLAQGHASCDERITLYRLNKTQRCQLYLSMSADLSVYVRALPRLVE